MAPTFTDNAQLFGAAIVDAGIEYSPLNWIVEKFGGDLNPNLAAKVWAEQEGKTPEELEAAIKVENQGGLLTALRKTADDAAQGALDAMDYAKILGIVAAAGLGVFVAYKLVRTFS